MADEFERVMSLMLDRMDARLRDINAGAKQADEIDKLKSELHKLKHDADYIQQELAFANARITARHAEDQKLFELWQAADAIRSKSNKDVTAADRQRLAKALDEAQSACDQIPF